jgi:hypothetical protein
VKYPALQLLHEGGASDREIARSLSLTGSSVALTPARAAAARLRWPLPATLSDRVPEAMLYAGQTVDVIDGRTGEVRPAQIFVAAMGASDRGKPSPIMGEGWERVRLPPAQAKTSSASQDVKKHPPDGAAVRASHELEQLPRAGAGRPLHCRFCVSRGGLVVEINGGRHDSSSPWETSGAASRNNEVLTNPDVSRRQSSTRWRHTPPNPLPSWGRAFRQSIEER